MMKPSLLRAAGWMAVVVAVTACTEPKDHPRATEPAPALEARLAFSDSNPSPGIPVRVFVRVTGPLPAPVASFTARLRYDTLSLRFLGESPLGDGATRVVNPTAGLVRVAGVVPDGFAAGQLAAFDFEVLRANAVRTVALGIDEMHLTTRATTTVTVPNGGRLP